MFLCLFFFVFFLSMVLFMRFQSHFTSLGIEVFVHVVLVRSSADGSSFYCGSPLGLLIAVSAGHEHGGRRPRQHVLG